jgi:tRNA1(Val) A37 N6-methylase TrmN6
MGIDTNSERLAECAENAELNGAAMELKNQDILKWRTTRTFDLVMTNPPYFSGTPAAHGAHHNADLAKWTNACLARVRPRGYFCTIVDAAAAATIISAMTPKCGDIHILPLFGAKNTAERVLISGRLGIKTGATLHAGLKMNDERVLRDGLTIHDLLATLGSNV